MDTFILNMGCRAAGVLLNTEHENRAEKESWGWGPGWEAPGSNPPAATSPLAADSWWQPSPTTQQPDASSLLPGAKRALRTICWPVLCLPPPFALAPPCANPAASAPVHSNCPAAALPSARLPSACAEDEPSKRGALGLGLTALKE